MPINTVTITITVSINNNNFYILAAGRFLFRFTGNFSGSRRLIQPTFLTPSNGKRSTARRAGRVRPKPRVNTCHVEAMTTLRKHTNLFTGGELRDTNGALRWDNPFSGSVVEVSEFRKWIEYLLFETFVGHRRRRWGSGDGCAAEPGAAGDCGETHNGD